MHGDDDDDDDDFADNEDEYEEDSKGHHDTPFLRRRTFPASTSSRHHHRSCSDPADRWGVCDLSHNSNVAWSLLPSCRKLDNACKALTEGLDSLPGFVVRQTDFFFFLPSTSPSDSMLRSIGIESGMRYSHQTKDNVR